MDLELVLRAQSGDHAAFSALAAGALARLYRTARLILRDDDLASDAVQEALLAAWLDIRGIRQPDRFDAWLDRILIRSCYREAGRRRGRAVRLDIDALEIGAAGGQASVDDRDQLDRAFRQLTPEHRAVLVVHHYLGLRDAAAADLLGVPPGTFKSRLNRATAALRSAIDADQRPLLRPEESPA
jgi:RNA polymerase sigma-70 factor, ECF subfamily